MVISNSKVVTLSYELKGSTRTNELELIEQVGTDEPFVYLHGYSGLPPRFEEHLAGKKEGDLFAFVIYAHEAGYGEYSNEDIVSLPLSAFEIDGNIDYEVVKIGNRIPMVDESGNTIRGAVLEVSQDEVLMDFNHPLSGRDLHFSGTIISLREADPEEIAHGHVHGPDGHHH
ncbi:MAG: peptidylprolyl isomerase [Bacteroidia bacterium]|nr:peptidylprolyl isomerase [Bacteroidia bacterium]